MTDMFEIARQISQYVVYPVVALGTYMFKDMKTEIITQAKELDDLKITNATIKTKLEYIAEDIKEIKDAVKAQNTSSKVH